MNDQDKRDLEVVKENKIKHPDNRILTEIYEDDRNQVKDIINDTSQRFTFQDSYKAALFHTACIPIALEKLGVKNAKSIPDMKTAEKVLDIHNISFEKRQDNEENWRSGIYIYKNNELAYFISKVLNYTPSKIIVLRQDPLARYSVITNVMRA